MTESLRRPPRQERSERTVSAILDAADHVFGEHGYDKASTTLMAKQAGISVGAIYRFFPDKHAVAAALTERYHDERKAVYNAVALEVLAGGDDTIDRAVSTMLDGLAELNRKHPGYFVANAHLDPSVSESRLTAQAESLVAWFEMSPADLTRPECETVAVYTMAVTRALLDQLPDRPRTKRAAYLAEAKLLITTYLRSRLRPDLA